MSRIAVIDYGMGNLHSVVKALKKVAPEQNILISRTPQEIEQADKIVFPGVGAIRDCIAAIKNQNLVEAIEKSFKAKPFLAICVGMQALMTVSEENNGINCLNLLPGKVLKLKGEGELKVPHMGWNTVKQTAKHPIWHNIPDRSRFYFVHSYAVVCEAKAAKVGECEYGTTFDAVLAGPNWVAVQFHPEKSQTLGLQLLKNFVEWKL